MSTSAAPAPVPIPEHLTSLVDDAAVFPPGNAALPEALAAHREHLRAGYAALLGPFVVGDLRLPDLRELLDPDAPALGVTVVVSGGAGALEPAVRWSTRTPGLELRGLEVALRDEADLAHNARRMLTALDQLVAAGELDEDVPVHLEPPRLRGAEPAPGWLAALDEVAAVDHRLKFRTGGADADAFPGADELATCIGAALDRELRFKCTAGLHHALRHRDEETGFEHHGFLNVLLATRASLDGASHADVVDVLEERDGAVVVGRLRETGDPGLASARRWFTGFGSCSVLEPLEDLIDLDLLPNLPLERA